MTVHLVGAGPGDPGLLTRRGSQLLAVADVVVYDRLASSALLDLVPSNAKLVDVGKHPRPGIESGVGARQQCEINELLVEFGRTYETVVRLKGGDPFVFGRGGEEALALQEAGVNYSIVPGVSAAFAVPAFAGVPLTHRGVSASFTVVTGHRAEELDPVAWEAIWRTSDTLVILMGVQQRSLIAQRLIAGGKSATTPVLAVRWGSWSNQEVLRMTLGELGDAILQPPATIVIGEVASMHLQPLCSQPLAGLRVAVTRSMDQSSGLLLRLTELGAKVIALPTIKIEPPSDGGAALQAALARADSYDWIVFTSPNGARSVLSAVDDFRIFGNVKIAAIGPGTAEVLRAAHLLADLVPESNIGEGLLEAFPAPEPQGGKVLLARAEIARDVVPRGLRSAGWTVDVVPAYRTVQAAPDEQAIKEARTADIVTFTSASTVEQFCAMLPGPITSKAVCIGPMTTKAAKQASIEVVGEASVHTLDGLLDAVVEVSPAIFSDKRCNKLVR